MATCYAKEVKAIYSRYSASGSFTDTDNPYTHYNCNIQGDYALYRTFLEYDLSEIPYKSSITSAKLKMYCYDSYNDDTGGKSNVARVTESWEEADVSWGKEPATEGTYLAENAVRPADGTWTDWDITALVQEWVDQTYPNYGLHIINVDENVYTTEWWVRNRRYNNGSHATFIEIEYDPAETYRITAYRMTEIADQVRRITGKTETLTPAEIVETLTAVE